jgi:hypothetical protein
MMVKFQGRIWSNSINYFKNGASVGSMAVEHLPHHPKVGGSCPASINAPQNGQKYFNRVDGWCDLAAV